MAGMTNPAIKNLESRMSELEREMSDLREKIESKETTINKYNNNSNRKIKHTSNFLFTITRQPN